MSYGNTPEYKREWYLKNKERILAKSKAAYAAEPEKFMARQGEYRKTESGKEARKRERSNYQSKPEVKASRAARQRLREALKNKSAILVGDEWNDFVIEEMYQMCKTREIETGVKWQVDHLVPLNGREVCGMHVWYNLQLLTALDNVRKSNKLLEVD